MIKLESIYFLKPESEELYRSICIQYGLCIYALVHIHRNHNGSLIVCLQVRFSDLQGHACTKNQYVCDIVMLCMVHLPTQAQHNISAQEHITF